MKFRLEPHPEAAVVGTVVLALLCCAELLVVPAASAVDMVNDPKGFRGIPWGTALADLPDVTLIESAARIKQFGPLDLSPGQVAKGILQQFFWFGPETEVNLSYDVRRDRGLIFIESRALAMKFVEGMAPDSDLAGATY